MTSRFEDHEARYRAVTVETDTGWIAAVALFEDAYCEAVMEDSSLYCWCNHNHRTSETAERCIPPMKRVAKRLNEKLIARRDEDEKVPDM